MSTASKEICKFIDTTIPILRITIHSDKIKGEIPPQVTPGLGVLNVKRDYRFVPRLNAS